jgi:hypothetical protein
MAISWDNQPKEFDIRINNSPRATNGKGYRAITYTSFLYGLMQYALSKERSHPGFMVFDSPLTTFKERAGIDLSEEQVSQNVEQAFFNSLAKTEIGQQVIVLEPDLTISRKMNYVHFSGQTNVGRRAFLKSLRQKQVNNPATK